MTSNISPPAFKVGDPVKVRNSGDPRTGRIVEYRGPLAPGGVHVYGVRRGRKPYRRNIEVREDQLELVTKDEQATSSSQEPV